MEKPQKLLFISDPDYRAVRAVSKSSLDWFAKSPAHYKHVVINRNYPAPTAAMTLGSAFDCLLLTPEDFQKTYVVAPDMRRGTKAWDEFESANAGKIIIKESEHATLTNMIDAVRSHKIASSLLSNGQSQVSYTWHDKGSGLTCKGRADYVRDDGILVDVKTTMDASPRGFASSVASFRYHVQAAMYLAGEAQATGRVTDQFCFIAVEKEAPYSVAVYTLDAESLRAGVMTYTSELVRLAECMRQNYWPTYSDQIETIRLPRWALGGE